MAVNKILYDTNELLDWMIDTRKNYEKAKEALHQVFLKNVEGYVTSHSLTDVLYISRKEMSAEKRKEFLIGIMNNFTVLVEPNKTFLEVLSNPDFKDLEAGLQMQCANEAELDYIITENIKDFTNSKVKALTAKEFIEL